MTFFTRLPVPAARDRALRRRRGHAPSSRLGLGAALWTSILGLTPSAPLVAGLSASNLQYWHQEVFSILDAAEAGDSFGSAVAVGNFDGDSYEDLAVGVFWEDYGTVTNSGAVNVMYGAAGGLTSGVSDQFWHQASTGIADDPEQSDELGAALAVGNFNNDAYDDLAIGVPGEDIASATNTGAVHVLYGSATGLVGAGSEFLSSIVFGGLQSNESFGAALSAGDFDDDGFDDLAIGIPGRDVSSQENAGAVAVFFGGVGGISAVGAQLWHQDSSGLLDEAAAFDLFGSALTVGDYDADGYDDLAVGVPFEDVGIAPDAGAVQVLYGSSSGPSATDQLWTQDSVGILGGAAGSEHFGFSLETGDFDDDGWDDLAVGIPQETVSGFFNRGAVQVLYGSSSGLSSAGDQLLHQDTPGMLGTAEGGDHFGKSLAAGDYDADGRDDLAVGIQYERVGGTNAGAVQVIYSDGSGLGTVGNQLLTQEIPGVPGDPIGFAGFGYALAAGELGGEREGADLAVGVTGDLVAGVQAGSVVIFDGRTCFFCDGFESGDVSVWSSSAP